MHEEPVNTHPYEENNYVTLRKDPLKYVEGDEHFNIHMIYLLEAGD